MKITKISITIIILFGIVGFIGNLILTTYGVVLDNEYDKFKQLFGFGDDNEVVSATLSYDSSVEELVTEFERHLGSYRLTTGDSRNPRFALQVLKELQELEPSHSLISSGTAERRIVAAYQKLATEQRKRGHDDKASYYMKKATDIHFQLDEGISESLDGPPTWEKFFGGQMRDEFRAMKIKFGQLFVAGMIQPQGSDYYNGWILKLTETGHKIWEYTLKKEKHVGFRDIHITSHEQVIVVGSYQRDATPKHYDGIVLKLDVQGNELWQRTFGGNANDVIKAVAPSNDDGYIIAGYTQSGRNNTGADAWLFKLDETGTVVWERTFGGNFWDKALALATLSNGEIIVAGTTELNESNLDAWLWKLDKQGKMVWERTFGGNDKDEITALALDKKGDILVAGNTVSKGNGKTDVWVLKFDKLGRRIWERTFGGSQEDKAYSLKTTSDNGVIVAGQTFSKDIGQGDVWLLRLDKWGGKVWERTFGGIGEDGMPTIEFLNDNRVLVSGYTWSKGAGKSDGWVFQLEINQFFSNQVTSSLRRAKEHLTLIPKHHYDEVVANTFSVFFPDSKTLISGRRCNISLWNLNKKTESFLSTTQCELSKLEYENISFSVDRKTIAILSGGSPDIIKNKDNWNNKKYTDFTDTEYTFGYDQSYPTSVALSFDGKKVAACCYGNDRLYKDGKIIDEIKNDVKLKLWETSTGKQILSLIGISGGGLGFSPDGKLVLDTYDGMIKFLNIESTRQCDTVSLWTGEYPISVPECDISKLKHNSFSIGNHSIRDSIKYSPDGRTLAYIGEDKTIKIWNIKSKRLKAVLKGHTDDINSIAFFPNGKLLASGSSDNTIRIWNLESAKTIVTLNKHKDSVNSVAFSSDGKFLASGSSDGTIKVWLLQNQ